MTPAPSRERLETIVREIADLPRHFADWRNVQGWIKPSELQPLLERLATLAAVERPRPLQPQEEFRSGSTHPEFDEWWEKFGVKLHDDPRINERNLAFAAWMSAWDRSSVQTRRLLSGDRQ